MFFDLQGLQDIRPVATGKAGKNDLPRLKKACQMFEAMFINELFKEMRKTVPEGGLIKKQNSDKIYQSLLDQEYATKMAEAGGIGLGNILYGQLSETITRQGKAQGAVSETKREIMVEKNPVKDHD